nr:MAG TPA: hypothetical protein [Caudoviricetes sp.]
MTLWHSSEYLLFFKIVSTRALNYSMLRTVSESYPWLWTLSSLRERIRALIDAWANCIPPYLTPTVFIKIFLYHVTMVGDLDF